ncbi:MAG: arabinofuranan 3-O-arabinosyltransferase [Blastococcus sp.]|nr:arabinofuranan 3-O-arabinosyltransferase [Blastococcus sp.]
MTIVLTSSGSTGNARLRATLLTRARSVVVCLAFAGLTLSQQPGRILPDTKLDLAVDPWPFLARALTLWDGQEFAGQVQNQAYGYLFPMGPFFALARTAGIPAWITQRLWMALLLTVAFAGVMALARRLHLGSPEARLVGALAYALAPRMISGLGATSVEMLPMALAPWVLVPLVTGARRGSPRRAAALSALAVFCVGGVNAVATAAVLPLGALWLLTRPPGPRRRRLMGWWVACVALATAWWAGPLLLLGRYSPPFLDYIESARTTTAPTGLLSALRGTTQWVAYLADPSGPVWPAGWALVHDTVPLLATVVLAGAGLLGLARADLPDRAWLVLGLLTGLTLVTLGHLGPVQGLLASPAHSALDGVLAPLRNVHKFDPVLRLPLALGVTHLCGRLFRRVRRSSRLVAVHGARAGVVLLAAALLATASPAIAGRLAAPTGFTGIPGYWQQTADWLAAARPSGRALLVPGSSFGTYFWGSTADEPLQALARSPWEVRDAVPLTPPAHIRMLDAVEQRLATGEGSAGLTRYLARAGISYLVVRNDLDTGTAQAPRSILVHRALADSPGITAVAAFGPVVPGATSLLGRVLDSGLTEQRPAVEIFAVADPVPQAWTTPLSNAVSVSGGPDAILALEDRGLLGGRPALLPDGGTPEPGTAMVSDAQLRRERTFGRVDDATSAGLSATDPLRLQAPASDYAYPGDSRGESVVATIGGTVSASGSASDVDGFTPAAPADQPFAAIDGDPTTAWRPPDRLGAPQPVWWRVAADRPITASAMTVTLAGPVGAPISLQVDTDRGRRTVILAATGTPQAVPLPAGPARSVTITEADGADRLALAEVAIPGLTVTRTVVTPAPDRPAAVYAFDATNPATGGCVTGDDLRPRCSAALAHAAEEPAGIDRVFTVAAGAAYATSLTAAPRPGPALDALISAAARPWGPDVSASSSVSADPRAGADAAMDGDPATSWVAAPDDGDPSLHLAWGRPLTVDRLRLVVTADTAASVPTSVGISDGGVVRTVQLDADGTARFAPLTTDHLTITFPTIAARATFDPYTRAVSPLGVGVSELEVAGLPVAAPATPVDVPCADGPTVSVDGVQRHTTLTTTLADLRALRPVHLSLCGDARPTSLATGRHRFLAASTAAFVMQSATLVRSDAAPPEPVARASAQVVRWGAEDRVLRLAGRPVPTLLVVPDNVNAGWTATLDGRPLAARTVDGWQQGYVLPAGAAGEVHLIYRPGTLYRAALAGGAVALLLLLAALLWRTRGAGPAPTGRRRGRALAVVGAVAGTALIGGGVGLAALTATTVVGWAAGRHRSAVLGVLAAGGLLGGALWMLGGATGDAGVQTLALVALTSVVATVLLPARRAGRSATMPRHRRSGRSTSR